MEVEVTGLRVRDDQGSSEGALFRRFINISLAITLLSLGVEVALAPKRGDSMTLRSLSDDLFGGLENKLESDALFGEMASSDVVLDPSRRSSVFRAPGGGWNLVFESLSLEA